MWTGTSVRATEDLDLFIRATADNVERLRAALRAAYDNDPHIEESRRPPRCTG